MSSEPVLQLLEELDAKVQPHNPVDWTVRLSCRYCIPVLFF